jgi:hypothetical protein
VRERTAAKTETTITAITTITITTGKARVQVWDAIDLAQQHRVHRSNLLEGTRLGADEHAGTFLKFG